MYSWVLPWASVWESSGKIKCTFIRMSYKAFTIWPSTTLPGKLNDIFHPEVVFDWVTPSVLPQLCMHNPPDFIAPLHPPLVGPASWACSPCRHTAPFPQKGSELGSMPCHSYPEFLILVEQGAPHFHFAQGPTNYVLSRAYSTVNSLKTEAICYSLEILLG